MNRLQIQTQMDEADVRSGITAALVAEGAKVVTNESGHLVVHLGSVGKAFSSGPLRNTAKMPVEIVVTTSSRGARTTVVVEVRSHGTGGGFLSGGLIGVARQRRAEQLWAEKVGATIRGQLAV
jgi:hypothetical protein